VLHGFALMANVVLAPNAAARVASVSSAGRSLRRVWSHWLLVATYVTDLCRFRLPRLRFFGEFGHIGC
jgi:hypothetical protein